MPRVSFDEIPGSGRVWMFGTDRLLADQEQESLLGADDAFLDGWAAHGTPLVCARDWRHDHFLLVAVDEASVPPSGCSIDAMIHVLKGEESRLGVRIVDNTPVWFLDEGSVRRVTRAEFKALVEQGTVEERTTVFDNTVTLVSEVREGVWERPAGAGWHARAFFAQPVRGSR